MALLTTEQVAERYGVEVQTVSRWCQRGLFPNLERGPRTGRGAIYLIPESDLENFTPPRMGRPTVANASPATEAKRRSRDRQRDPE
jgi:predicted site-specific integrase-resolvase